jgi:diguanylate cyclase (GGDEF)-like protein
MNKSIRFLNSQTDYLATILLAVFAFLSNTYFVVSIFATIDVYWGSVFVLLSLVSLRFRYSWFVLAASLIPILFLHSDILAVLTQVAEYFVVSYLLKNKIRFLPAISLFWLLIGLPVASLFFYFHLAVNIQTALFVAFTFVSAGYLCGLLALLALWLLPLTRQSKRKSAQPPAFAKLVFELNAVSVIMPVVVVSLFFVWSAAEDRELSLAYDLNQAAQEFNRSLLSVIDNKIHTLSATADILMSEDNRLLYTSILNSVATSSANIESMVLADKDANILVAAPEQYAAMLPDLKDVNISHRKYFQQTKERLESVVSRAIKGSGLGDFDIVAITAPIIVDGEFQGLVQGAITLDRFADKSVLNAIQNDEVYVVITDNEGSIIHASDIFGLKQLDTFKGVATKHPFSNAKTAMNVNGIGYMYEKYTNKMNWNIYTFTPPIRIFEGVSVYFVFITVSMLSSMLLITLLSKGLATKITKPLLNLESFMAGKSNAQKMLAESKVSKEMQNVTQHVIDYHKISEDFQHELKAQVEEKTQELRTLNKALFKLSQTDALTGLYNRGAFDNLAANTYNYCQRHKKALTLAIFDIDHFKDINDQYGHVAGDACIIDVAGLIESKCRRETDIIARYGGEEFILLLASDNHEQHEQYVNLIHNSVQKHEIVHGEHTITVTVSGGAIKVHDDFSKDLTSLITLADEQLYLSKHQGRDRINIIEI